MSSTYAFLPWARQGLSRLIEGVPSGVRAAFPVAVEIAGTPAAGAPLTRTVPKTVTLFGPGDVIGIDKRAIIRTEPRDWTADYEPNYLPSIEFYEEDFPWRYTPAAPSESGTRLTPWLALIVLREDEFRDAPQAAEQPLPAVSVNNFDAFPAHDQLWAWAHVHVNARLGAGVRETNRDAAGSALGTVVGANPDNAYSRLLSPRKLDANAAYHAFLMPAFESGRLAGLKLDPAGAPSATHGAWTDYPARAGAQPNVLPYYHRWYFRTGGDGDFESLVRKLRPRSADPQIGRRDMDVSRIGAGRTGPLPTPAGGRLKLGGALQAPRRYLSEEVRETIERDEAWFEPAPHPLQVEMARVVNLPDDIQRAAGPDPIVAPPIYGAWHAERHRLLEGPSGEAISEPVWLHQLNLDPRYRAPAGLGVRVVQKNQEDYMAAAWSQVGDVLAAVKRIRLGWMALAVVQSWTRRHLAPLVAPEPARFVTLIAPLRRRVLLGQSTLFAQLSKSMTPAALFSAPLRRILRPNGRIAKASGITTRGGPLKNLAERVDRGALKPAPDKTAPKGAARAEDVREEARPRGLAGALAGLARAPVLLLFTVLVLLAFVVLAFVAFGVIAAGAIGAALTALAAGALLAMRRALQRARAAALIDPAVQTPESVDTLPMRPAFTLAVGAASTMPAAAGRVDSADAVRFKTALKETYALVQAHRARPRNPPLTPLNLSPAASSFAQQLDPYVTIPRYIRGGLAMPTRIIDNLRFDLDEPMNYPRIDLPMYKPLEQISAELLAPNLAKILPDTVTLLETNQAFIESYMVGLNDEFGRELLWREYPTDQRGSYFRQFWDVSSYLAASGADPEAAREALYDITKIHTWRPREALGDHDNRQSGTRPREEAVLAVRGQLLKRYPTTLVYAHAAAWRPGSDGRPDRMRERMLAPLTEGERDDPPTSKIRTPIYSAHVAPDIYFFGFDLSPEDAMGDASVDDRPGWFFVFEERPGEPRFGADLSRSGGLVVWNDLAWTDIAPGGAGFIPAGAAAASLSLAPAGPDEEEKADQAAEDAAVSWGPTADAGALAYMLFQAPSRVAYHAREMLQGATGSSP